MNAVVNTSRTLATRDDLLTAGFTSEQIERLEALGAMYPYIELFDSRQELQRLQFVKWMVGRRIVASR